MKRAAFSLISILSAVLCVAASDKKETDVNKDVKRIAWKAYVEATALGVLAEEGPEIAGEFTLDRDVEGLGRKGDKIHEVRFTVLGGPRTRGLILVNRKRRQSLVVFPKRKTPTEQSHGEDVQKAGPRE